MVLTTIFVLKRLWVKDSNSSSYQVCTLGLLIVMFKHHRKSNVQSRKRGLLTFKDLRVIFFSARRPNACIQRLICSSNKNTVPENCKYDE